MATPLAIKQAIAATPPVSTPFNHLSAVQASPRPPRSGSHRPSPEHYKKSPANSQTLYGHGTPSFGLGAMYMDSPTTAALAALPMSEMGLSDGMMGNLGVLEESDEEKNKRNLQSMIDILSRGHARVSEEGIERLAKKYKLECLWEDQPGSGGKTRRNLIIAGTLLAVDISFENGLVGRVALTFPEAKDSVAKHAESGGMILSNDLQLGRNESALTKTLARFEGNLARLAMLDHLSVAPLLNCYEAITGIYESLKKLHEWEVKKESDREDVKDKSEVEARKRVLRSRSGRPRMNARGQLGLSIDYWQEPRRKLDIKNTEDPKTWSINIECQKAQPNTTQPIRISDQWIADDIESTDPVQSGFNTPPATILNWQEPPNIVLSTNNEDRVDTQMTGIDMLDPTSKLPEVSFVAKFDPPLAIPYSLASELFTSLGATMKSAQTVVSLDNLIIPPQPHEKPLEAGAYRQLRTQRALKMGGKTEVRHDNLLVVQKPEYGYLLEELPFYHIKGVIAKLPWLRLWARASSLLRTEFGAELTTPPPAPTPAPTSFISTKAYLAYQKSLIQQNPSDPLDISLTTSSTTAIVHTRFGLSNSSTSNDADIWLSINLNGELKVEDTNIGKKEVMKGLLEVGDDLGVWAGFIRDRNWGGAEEVES